MEERKDWHRDGGTRRAREKEREDSCEGVGKRHGRLGRRTGGLAKDSLEASPCERHKTIITTGQVLIRHVPA